MKMYDEENTGIAIKSGFVETHAGDLHVYADRTQAGNIVFITTDNFKKYIPIKWIEKWFSQFYGEQGLEWNRCKRFMLEDWEKESI